MQGELREVSRGAIELVGDHEVDVEEEEVLATDQDVVCVRALEREVYGGLVLVDAIG